jgi:hypothetical protein
VNPHEPCYEAPWFARAHVPGPVKANHASG